MNHFHSLLNVIEMIEIDKDTAKKMFEHYVGEFLQLAVQTGESVSEEDFRQMQEVAMAFGLSEKECQDAFEDADKSEKSNSKDEYDKYDKVLDNVPQSDKETFFSSHLNRWIAPEADSRFLY